MMKLLRYFIQGSGGLFFILAVLLSCNENKVDPPKPSRTEPPVVYGQAGEIPVPAGYRRVTVEKHSFGQWLRTIPLKKDKTVYLYNGKRKQNQEAQFAVLDIPVGDKDLQQCADAVMRLRAEYLFRSGQYEQIVFSDNNKKEYRWTGTDNRAAFERYLEMVFGWCGSASLEKQLNEVETIYAAEPGDVFIKGGFPGHAMLVMDVAVNDLGEKICLLSQSYMPAQSIHIVVNPRDEKMSPWFKVDEDRPVVTPEWKFQPHELRRW